MRVLFLENEDSFSWNVIDRLPCARDEVTVVPGREVVACPDRLAGADVLIIGPGPTDPERVGLVGVVRAAVARRLPTLGICLGHQAIGLAFGARLVRTPPRHGKRSVATFAGARIFAAFAGPQTVMRYHSLALADVASPLRVVATSEDGVIMAVEHEGLPLAGLQFHPDSFATPRGAAMIAGFFRGLA
jgi:anthranilate synthase/aminodeoxychorismate synthase-like glutamine amidotransferase